MNIESIDIEDNDEEIVILFSELSVLNDSDSFEIVIINVGGSFEILSGGSNDIEFIEEENLTDTSIVHNFSLEILQIGEMGIPGPPGPSGGPEIDMDKMVNPEYPISHRVFTEGPFGFTQILVYAGDLEDVLLFERSIEYDGYGDITSVMTDDMMGHNRLIIAGGRREKTTW